MLTLTLTEQEAVNLRNLLDAAVRAGGMRAAEVAIPLDYKIMDAARAAGLGTQRQTGNGGAEVKPGGD